MRVNQDSRTIKKGEWFVAVKGEDFDGHDFIPEALKKGAAGVLEEGELLDLAREKIRKLNPRVVAISGSYGKTSTKEAIAKVLSSEFKVLGTEGNINTPRGVAIEVVNRLKPGHDVVVAELGMDRLGEIAESCQILSPQVGVITSVGEMHLEKLKSLADIKKAKAELLESLPSNGVAVLNRDDRNVRAIAKEFNGRTAWYGLSSRAGLSGDHLKDVNLKLLGRGGKYAALAAYAVGKVFNLKEEGIAKALEQVRPVKGRLNLLSGRGGTEIIDDTYNAGPRSMKVAFEVLREFPAKRKFVVLGDMLELGKMEREAHRHVVREAVKVADRCIFVGERMQRASLEISGVYRAKDAKGAVRILERWKKGHGDVILIKGSRGMHMEEVVKSLLKDKKGISKLVS